MIYLRTGLPGGSKSLNTIAELVRSYNPYRETYYTNIRLLILDIDVAKSFSGWFYGWYFPRLQDKALKNKLIKIMKPIHESDEFLTEKDVPFLKAIYESHNHFDTWLHWVRKLYPANKLIQLESILDCLEHVEETMTSDQLFDLVRPLNLDFRHFEDPNFWFDLPKGSRILIDECQQFFPPRPVGSRKPQAIAKLETHRHGGYDLHFITQERTLVDQNLRKLVGRHIHYFNPFGGKRVTRYEAPKCVDYDNYHDKKQATKKPISHPTEFYGSYYSAEIHTHKFKFPLSIVFAVLVILLLFGSSLYFLSSFVFGSESPAESPQQLSGPNIKNAAKTSHNQTQPITQADLLMQYVNTVTTDVYISGAIGHSSSSGRVEYDYTFYRSTDDAVFHPKDVGLVVESVSECLANIVVSSVRKPITCNPFYVRVPVEDEDESKSQFFKSDESKSKNNDKVGKS